MMTDYCKKVERFVLPYAGGGGGGGTQQSFIRFYMKRLRPVVQTLTLLYTIFDRKGTPFAYHPQKIVPFHIPTERLLLNFLPEKPLIVLG